jgi:hypothetical protein
LVEGAEEEIANANCPEIRMFTVKRTIAFESKQNTEGNWAVCSTRNAWGVFGCRLLFRKKIASRVEQFLLA